MTYCTELPMQSYSYQVTLRTCWRGTICVHLIDWLIDWLLAASRRSCYRRIWCGPTSPTGQSQSSYFQWTEDQLVNQGGFTFIYFYWSPLYVSAQNVPDIFTHRICLLIRHISDFPGSGRSNLWLFLASLAWDKILTRLAAFKRIACAVGLHIDCLQLKVMKLVLAWYPLLALIFTKGWN